MKDHEGRLEEIEALEVQEAKEMLGVHLAVDGNNDKQTEVMRDTAERWKSMIHTGFLDRKESWTALTTTIMKTMEYPLPALTLNEDECRKIM